MACDLAECKNKYKIFFLEDAIAILHAADLKLVNKSIQILYDV
jgi:hypothetical protein